jgi:DNA-binding NarL/FixJ family response regulator
MKGCVGLLKLLLVDDHTLFRESLRRLLEGEQDLEICGDFASANEAMVAVSAGLQFDTALIDYELGEIAQSKGDGLDLVCRIRQICPQAQILIVTAGMDSSDLIRAVREHRTGVFLKTEPTAELLMAIQRTARGEQWISSRASLALLSMQDVPAPRSSSGIQRLGERESLVLRGVLEGKSNKEIGVQLELTESSVKAVLRKLFERTGVRSRSQLVRYAIEAQADSR